MTIQAKIKKAQSVVEKTERLYGFDTIAIAWKGGKDTTCMMHIILNMYGKVPFRVMFNDTTLEFAEVYRFIGKVKKLWSLDLVVEKHAKDELAKFHKLKNLDKKEELSRVMKINSLNRALGRFSLKGYMLGIRRDENPARANEDYFSKREDHIRIHPMLDFSEEDIWEYIRKNNVPYCRLYDQGYRSIGEKPFTKKSSGGERSGREQKKEEMMEKLRQMGYW